jgi:class 3 adenylate cyclase/tetratricopeptide (TPR) repeat protein
MNCARCNTPLLPGKAFCHECGARAPARCPRCGAPTDASFRFCPDCGAALSGAPAPAPPSARGTPEAAAVDRKGSEGMGSDAFERLRGAMPSTLAEKVLASRGGIEGERKAVTVLFCDVVGSATIAEGMDPEDYRELLDRYLAVVFERVYRFEGIVNQIAGDGVMALFGAPVAHEDAPERACQAALAIREGVAELGTALAAEGRPRLRIRIGINTGPVIVGTVGSDLKMDYTAIGDTTNLAARLQSLARPDAILISEATHRIVRQRFAFRPVGELAIRGKAAPVAAYEVLGELAADALSPRREAALSTFVGRREELLRLEDALAEVAASQGQVVDIVGEAGVGKSRLLYEFKVRAARERARVLEGECFSYARGAPYDAFARLLRRHLRITADDARPIATDRLAAAVRAWDPDLTSAFPVLARMLGLGEATVGEPSGAELKWAAFDAVARLILAETEALPVVLALEDLQWIDDASAELLASLVNRLNRARVLILCTYRPGYRAPWSHRPNVSQMTLGPLARDESAAIIAAMVGGEPPPELVDAIVRKAEGNPLFTEEMTRELLDEGIVLHGDHGPMLTRSPDELDVPMTIQEIVAARLDRLPPAAKRIVQVAAVIGRQFRTELVAELLREDGIEVDRELTVLEESGVIQPADPLARDEYLFHHALTQDVAYNGLLHRQRRQLHDAVGLALERRGLAACCGKDSAVLAYHFAQAGNRAKGIEYLLEAANHALAAPSYSSAADLFQQAWDLARAEGAASEPTARQTLAAGLGVLMSLAIFGEGRQTGVESLTAEVNRLLETVGTSEDRVAAASYVGLLEIMGAAERFESGLAHLERSLRLAEAEGLTLWCWRIRRSLALAYGFDGRFGEAAAITEQVLSEVTAAGAERVGPDVLLGARMLRDVVIIYHDDLDSGIAEAERTFAIAAEHNNRTIRVISAGLIATARLLRGEFAEARAWARRGLELAESIGSRASVPNLASIVVLADHAEGAPIERALLDHVEAELGAVAGVQQALRFVVDAFLAAGDVERAERVAQTVRRRSGGRFRQAYSARALGDVAAARGPEGWQRATYFYEEAARVARSIGSRSVLATTLLAHAHLLGRQGDATAALAALDEAMPHFDALAMRWHIAQGERLRERLVAGAGASHPS